MSKPILADGNVSLDEITLAMQQWREEKKAGKSRMIPDTLWIKIFSLSQSHEPKVIRGLLGISKEQYDNKYRQLIEENNPSGNQPVKSEEDNASPFCEVKMASPHEPSPLPKPPTDLVVVEIYRPDKSLLKIHTTAEKLDKVVQSFLAAGGEHHAANHQ